MLSTRWTTGGRCPASALHFTLCLSLLLGSASGARIQRGLGPLPQDPQPPEPLSAAAGQRLILDATSAAQLRANASLQLAELDMPEHGEKPWILERSEETLAAAAAAQVHPVVWVPGITSSPLAARRLPGPIMLGKPECEAAVPRSGWYPLYVSAGWATQPGCLLWQMQLQPPRKEDKCVYDAQGIEIQEVGFGTAQLSIINPGDLVPFHLYEDVIQMYEGLGLKRDLTIRFATYDWRKYGDPCWEREWFPKLTELIENTAHITGKTVDLGCHSMGCPVVHLYLNTMSAEWKGKHIHNFVATGPAFAGAAALFQNFIQGPSYAFMPMIVSTVGRATFTSFPSVYTLMPARLGGAWSEDLAFVKTPWKNYTLSTVYDDSFFDDVEMPELHNGQTFQEEEQDFEARHELWSHARKGMDAHMTELGCVCSGDCRTTGLGLESTSVLSNRGSPSHSWLGVTKPWCYTYGECGTRALRLRLTLNPFGIVNFRRWDFCNGASKPIDAGPGFEFYPGVNTVQSNILWRWAGWGESYAHDSSLSLEAQKARCLAQKECTGFDTAGNLKRGEYYQPDTSWRGMTAVKDGVAQGLYMKRVEVHGCETQCDSPSWFSDEESVCGSDGRTYASECELRNAACWKPHLRKASEGKCEDTYRTPLGCKCISKCERSGLWSQTYGCYVEGRCGVTSVYGRWDHCFDSGGIDTGRGFEYFDKVDHFDHVLQKLGWFETYHVDKLQEDCGKNPLCHGFSTDGAFYGEGFLGSAPKWEVADGKGLYRKKRLVVDCQSTCEAEEAPVAVCHTASRTTFPSRCAAENYRCWAEIDEKDFQTRPGPCQRYGDGGLHEFAQRHAERVEALGPPGVPTACMYITDVETDLAWSFDDFLQAGTGIQTSPGDGTVNAMSAEGPCRSWSEAQGDEAKVQLIPLKLGGASHVDMLWNHGFLDGLKQVSLQSPNSCQRVDGAIARNSGEAPLCKCAAYGEKVFCGSENVAERKFNVVDVLERCSDPACRPAAK